MLPARFVGGEADLGGRAGLAEFGQTSKIGFAAKVNAGSTDDRRNPIRERIIPALLPNDPRFRLRAGRARTPDRPSMQNARNRPPDAPKTQLCQYVMWRSGDIDGCATCSPHGRAVIARPWSGTRRRRNRKGKQREEGRTANVLRRKSSEAAARMPAMVALVAPASATPLARKVSIRRHASRAATMSGRRGLRHQGTNDFCHDPHPPPATSKCVAKVAKGCLWITP